MLALAVGLAGCSSASSPQPAPTVTVTSAAGPAHRAALGPALRQLRKAIEREGFSVTDAALHAGANYWPGLQPVVVSQHPDEPCFNVFFLAHGRYVGRDSRGCHLGVQVAWGDGHEVAVTYAHYARRDPVCCPSRNPILVRYAVSASGVRRASQQPPPSR